MTDKQPTQIIDKTTRNRIFSSRYWKQQCFALNAQSIIDKAIKIKAVGGLYGGAKKPTKFLCLVFKMLQMNLGKQIATIYLGQRQKQYKYLVAMSLLYLRLTLKSPEVYEVLQPFYVDSRKLRLRNSMGQYQLTFVDKFVEDLLGQEVFMGLTLPFIPKRLALQMQGVLKQRQNLFQQQLNEREKIKNENLNQIEQQSDGKQQQIQ